MRRSFVLPGLLGLALLGAGCGQSSFFGKRFDNFTAYYNTFYNAEKALEEGAKGVETGQEGQPIDQDVYLPLFGGAEQVTTQRQPFEDAIKKSADILRKHPNSKWVDDALLVIGKAWFYTQNYVGAEQKFREVMTLESRLHDEARFWLARTLIASGQYEAAFDHLQESLNREDVSRRWEPTLRLALAELHVQRQNWDEAAAELETGLDGVRDKELGARAQFLLAQVYETLGRHEDAIAAYERVRAYNPFYELSYAAQFSAVRVEGEHGDPEKALLRLRRMERDDKNYDHRSELDYLHGRIYQAAGRYDDALDTYYELLYDPDARATTVRGRIHYALGEFYRDVYEDFALAAAHFDTASTSLQRPTGRGPTGTGNAARQADAPAAITDSEEQARVFGGFAGVMERISRMDSLLYVGSLDDSTFQAFVLELRQQRAKELEAQRREMERLQAERQFQQAGANLNVPGRGLPPGKQIDTPSSNAGFLYHRDPIRVQEGRAAFLQRWGDRPLVPNWRRIEAASEVAGGRGEEVPGERTAGAGLAEAGLPEVDVSDVPRDSLSRRQKKAERAVARYELANVLFLAMNRPDSAAAWYRMVIEEDQDEPVAQRAYYALAEVQRSLGDTLSAHRLYRTILELYPSSDFAERSHERLGLRTDGLLVPDTLTLAEAAYDEAYAAWQRRHYEQSLNDLVALAIQYPDTDVAPRALYAAGSVYLEWARRDSLDVFGALPLATPDSVLRASGLLRTEAAEPGAAQPPAPDAGTPVKQVDQPVKQVDQPVKQVDQPVKQVDQPVEQTDSLTVVTDSLAQEVLPVPGADSLAVDSLAVDSLAVDSLAVDSLAVDSLVTVDSTEEAAPEALRLEMLYSGLLERYPQAPQAQQARRVLEALQERRTALQAVADSLALAAAAPASTDSLVVADTLVGADSLVVDSLARVVATPDPEEAEDRPVALRPEDVLRASERRKAPVDSNAVKQQQNLLQQVRRDRQERLKGEEEGLPREPSTLRIDRALGGYTLVVASRVQRAEAEAEAETFRRRFSGLPVDVLAGVSDGSTRYRVVVGQVSTAADAAALRDRLEDDLPEDTWVTEIEQAQPAPVEIRDAAVADTAAVEPVAEPPTANPDQPAGAPPSPGLGAIDWSKGGWTILVRTETTSENAAAFARYFGTYVQSAGYPLDVFTALVREEVEYRVGVGLFESESEAQEAFARLKPQLPDEARILRVPKAP